MHPGRICRCSEDDDKSLLKIRERSYKRPWWTRWKPEAVRANCFQVLLKSALTYGRGEKPGQFLIINLGGGKEEGRGEVERERERERESYSGVRHWEDQGLRPAQQTVARPHLNQ
jgi:hypothetical protein